MPLPTSPFQIINPLFSSQSATSCYAECPRRYLYQYRLYGTGIVPKFSSVPLLTGGTLHKAVEEIASLWLSAPKPIDIDIDKVVAIAQDHYKDEVRKRPLGNPHSEAEKEEQEYIFYEQLALVEALIRTWYIREWPKIIQYYDILAVEQEITFNLGSVIYQSKPDLILLHKTNGDVINYSLKTTKMWNERTEKGYKVALQAITEPYATSIWLKELAESLGRAKEFLQAGTIPQVSYMSKGLGTISRTLEKYSNLPTRSSATRFCYLIKGDRKESERGNGKYRTDNPFIYGLRKITTSGIEYAWTWWTKNPNNKSGYGRLGKGWEQFSVWNDGDVGGVKGWIDMLMKGVEVIPDLGDGHVIDKHVLSMPDVYSNWGLIERRIRHTKSIETKIYQNLHVIKDSDGYLEELFPMNTGSCFFPTPCDYLTICPNGNDYFKEHIANDPLNPEYEKYERRVSHHEEERLSIEEFEKGKEEEIENVDQ